MTYLLDTNACVDALKGEAQVVRNLASQSPDECAISTVTAYELYTGMEKCADPEKEREKVVRFLDSLHLLAFEDRAAQEAARIRADLEAAGTPIGPYDILIAGHALAVDLVLVTHNVTEFSRVPGLKIQDWNRREGSTEDD